MSSEGDSSKSGLLENNEKSGSNPDTDSSQDAQDINDAKIEKASAENSTEEKEEKDEKLKTETKEEVKPVENNEKPQSEEKTEADTKPESEEVDNENVSKNEKKPKKEKVNKEKKEVQKEKDEEKSEGTSEEEEDDDDEGSEKDGDKDVPLLDQPLEKTGKRERKNVQRFNEEFAAEPKEGPKVEFTQGSGTSLGDIPRIDASISRFKNEDLKVLHRVLFKTVGKTTLIKKNIRKFNGFDFKKDSEEYTKKFSSMHKLELKHLKSICEMLDLPKSGPKEDIITHIMEFLVEPKDSGKPLDGGRPKRTAAVRANNRGYSSHDDYSSDEKEKISRARRDKGKRTNLKDDSSSDEEFQPNSDGSEEKSKKSKRKRKSQKKQASDEDESEASLGSSDDSDDEPKTKRKKSPAKTNSKSKTKSTSGRRGRPSASAKKTPSRGRKAKDPSSEEEESDKNKDDGSSSEDEPLAKKAKSSQPPTDDEIKTFIKSILEGANLEEITMKTVCQRVYDNYPDFDLTHKKYFIKSTVKSLIST